MFTSILEVNLRCYSLAPGPILSYDFIPPPPIFFPPHLDPIANSFQREVDRHSTINHGENLPEAEAEEVETDIEAPRNTSRNSNSHNNIDYRKVKWLKNNLESKRDQNGSIPRRTRGIQTVTTEVAIEGCESRKGMSRCDFFLLTSTPSQLTQCTLLTTIALRRYHIKETILGELLKYF